MAALTAASPKSGAAMSDIYLAVEQIKDYAVGMDAEFQNEGDLVTLTDQLAWLRDRADRIQSAAIGVQSAFSEFLD